MDVRKTESIKKGDQVVGSRHRIKIIKNKVAPPFKQAEFAVNGEGIDKEDALIEAAILTEVITKAGAFLKRGDKVLAQGRAQLAEFLKKDPELKKEFMEAIHKKMFPAADEVEEAGVTTPVEEEVK